MSEQSEFVKLLTDAGPIYETAQLRGFVENLFTRITALEAERLTLRNAVVNLADRIAALEKALEPLATIADWHRGTETLASNVIFSAEAWADAPDVTLTLADCHRARSLLKEGHIYG